MTPDGMNLCYISISKLAQRKAKIASIKQQYEIFIISKLSHQRKVSMKKMSLIKQVYQALYSAQYLEKCLMKRMSNTEHCHVNELSRQQMPPTLQQWWLQQSHGSPDTQCYSIGFAMKVVGHLMIRASQLPVENKIGGKAIVKEQIPLPAGAFQKMMPNQVSHLVEGMLWNQLLLVEMLMRWIKP